MKTDGQDFFMFADVEGVLKFIRVPPNPSYARNGSNAKLVWDYSVDNKRVELGGIIYSVRDTSGVFKEMLIQLSDGTVLKHSNIPPVYNGRVRIEGKATLVIDDVTPQDSTVFRCKIIALLAPHQTSTVELIVSGMYCKLIAIPSSETSSKPKFTLSTCG